MFCEAIMASHPKGSASAANTLSTEDFSFFIWRKIFRAIAENEKAALQNLETVSFELEVSQRRNDLDDKEAILKIELVCEPGKPPKAISIPAE